MPNAAAQAMGRHAMRITERVYVAVRRFGHDPATAPARANRRRDRADRAPPVQADVIGAAGAVRG